MKDKRLHISLLLIFFAVFIWSLINPYDYFTWVLEIFPAMLGLIVVLATYNRFRLSDLAYTLITAHAMVLFIGGHYTYARMPLFDWLKDALELQRNYYDRLGHLAQGFVPAILAREVLLRTSPLKKGKWLFVIVLSICLSISALYEFLEWGVAVLTGTAADDFLGTQGDVWDTQWDMLMALIGAISAQVFFARIHDKNLAGLENLPTGCNL